MARNMLQNVLRRCKMAARLIPVVTDQEMVWVGKPPSKVRLGQRSPYRVWTLFNDTDPHSKPKLPYRPEHNKNAFLEDFGSDWRFKEGWLHYYSRVPSIGSWLLIEYADNNPYETATYL